MQFLVGVGFYTIWFTPVIFVTNLIGAIKLLKKGDRLKNIQQHVVLV